MKTVIVGGVAGGASAAARLRRLDEKAQIILLERGEYISYANCGLPYYISGKITQKSALTLQTPKSFFDRFNVDVRINNEAIAIDTKNKTVTVRDSNTGNEYAEAYDRLILSMGAEPIKPPIPGIDSKRVFTVRNIPDILKIKDYLLTSAAKKAVVVGGGFIGLEMAENLKLAGLDVTLVELSDHIVASLDYDMACHVNHYAQSQGLQIILNNGVKEIQDNGNHLTVQLQEGSVDADFLILAVGVKPETKLAKEAGIALNTRGSIIVNEQMQTSEPDIYAVGDAVQVEDFFTKAPAFVPLAGPANRQGRIAADNICGINSHYNGTQGTAILKLFDMAVASTGLNENSAKEAGYDYDKVYLYSASHATYYPNFSQMAVKVLYEKGSGKILGAQIVGYDGVDKRCDIIATVIRMGGTANDLTKLELSYAPPFGSAKDPVNMAGFVIENVLSGKMKQFHWHDVEKLPRDGSVQLLDVRTPGEVREGMIEGFRHIPVDELRAHLQELDPAKPIYVNCQSGLRSYIACRILTANDFDCYNLAGGYGLYSTVRLQG